jgi:hypothetical protein
MEMTVRVVLIVVAALLLVGCGSFPRGAQVIEVRTTGYQPGDCIEATVHSDDGEDVAVGVHTLVLRGRVDGNGAALFRAPLKDLTLQH